MHNDNSNSNNSLTKDDFEEWKDHPVTQLVIRFHLDRQIELLDLIRDMALHGAVVSEAEQIGFHKALQMYQDFIDLDHIDIESYYEVIIDEDDTARLGKGVSSTG